MCMCCIEKRIRNTEKLLTERGLTVAGAAADRWIRHPWQPQLHRHCTKRARLAQKCIRLTLAYVDVYMHFLFCRFCVCGARYRTLVSRSPCPVCESDGYESRALTVLRTQKWCYRMLRRKLIALCSGVLSPGAEMIGGGAPHPELASRLVTWFLECSVHAHGLILCHVYAFNRCICMVPVVTCQR